MNCPKRAPTLELEFFGVRWWTSCWLGGVWGLFERQWLAFHLLLGRDAVKAFKIKIVIENQSEVEVEIWKIVKSQPQFFIISPLSAEKAMLAWHLLRVLEEFLAFVASNQNVENNLTQFRQHSIPAQNQFRLQNHRMMATAEPNIVRDLKVDSQSGLVELIQGSDEDVLQEFLRW